MLIPNVNIAKVPAIKHFRYSVDERTHTNFISFNKNDTIRVDIDVTGGVSMSNLSHKDILESERILNEKIDDVRTTLKTEFTNGIEGVSSKIDSTHSRIDKLHGELIEINQQLVSMRADIKNLPDKINASKWEMILKTIIIPVSISLVTAFLLIKFGLKT